MSSTHHALWPWSPVVSTLVLLNTAYPLPAPQADQQEGQTTPSAGRECHQRLGGLSLERSRP